MKLTHVWWLPFIGMLYEFIIIIIINEFHRDKSCKTSGPLTAKVRSCDKFESFNYRGNVGCEIS